VKILSAIASIIITAGSVLAGDKLDLRYDVDLTKIEKDSFFVTLHVKGIQNDTTVFQFASTAPGTYQVMDIGRFVGGFTAYDEKGRVLPVIHRSVNQYVIAGAKKLHTIRYQVEDSYDTIIKEDQVGPMSGSSIETDNVLLNGQMVFGYFQGFQSNPMQIKYNYPQGWLVGTALEEKNGTYKAKTFDEVVDSPFLFGKLTKAGMKIGGAQVDVFCHAKNGTMAADSLLSHLKDILISAEQFLGGLPVKRYAFLYKFTSDPLPAWGAWEHSYSSFYILPESISFPSGGGMGSGLADIIRSTAAHEFFHIVTPLNIHSEIIERFNFEQPTPSRHLWFYEGVTEWAAQIMQVRSGLVQPNEFCERVSQKMSVNDNYDPRVSLVDLSLGSYGHLNAQYQNIYAKGALTAMLLDMRLLELSKGKTGLRDVVLKLSKKYGPDKAFPDSEFFEINVKMTYPEIDDFIKRYIQGNEPLPVSEYIAKAGYDYVKSKPTGRFRSVRGTFSLSLDHDKVVVSGVDTTDEVNRQTGIREGDVILGMWYQDKLYDLRDPAMQQIRQTMQPGESFAWKIERDTKEMMLQGTAGKIEIMENHVITPVSEPSAEQQQFHSWWLKPFKGK